MVLPGFGIISEVLPVFARKPIFGYKAIAAATVVHRASSACSCGRTTCSPRRARRSCSSSSCSASFLIAVPDGREDLQLDRDAVARARSSSRRRCCSRVGFIGDVPHRRHHRHLPRRLPGRLAAHRHLLRRRALPLRADGRRGLRDLRRALLLVPEDHRAGCSARASGKRQLLADAHRLPRHLPDPALDRASTGMPRRIYEYPDVGHLELYNLISTVGSFILGARRAASPSINVLRSVKHGADRRARPVEGQHAGVVHDLAAAGQQLRRRPARALGRADEGHPPPGRAPDGADRARRRRTRRRSPRCAPDGRPARQRRRARAAGRASARWSPTTSR